MSINVETKVAKPGASKTTFSLLPREYYVSQDIFNQERERIFAKDWIYAAHLSHIPQKGDYVIVKYATEEIVIVRGDGDEVFANLNFCRHRGYRLCAAQSGHVSSFVCGYHQWRFNLDGGLRHVPRMRDGEYFDYKDFGLRTAKVHVWNGLIFVHLAEGEAEPLGARLEPFNAIATKFDPRRTRLAHEKPYDIAANWKVVVENAMECYHCAATHSSLCAVIDVPRLMSELKDWLADGDGAAPTNLGLGGMRVQSGMATMSPDGSLICEKLLGEVTAQDVVEGIGGGVMVVPNFFYAAFYVDHWWTISIRPKSATETELVYSWYVREDAQEGADYSLQKLIEVGDNTQTEDNVLIERTQRGIGSRYFSFGPIGSDVEPALYDFTVKYRKFMD